jgi:hypothetical protein
MRATTAISRPVNAMPAASACTASWPWIVTNVGPQYLQQRNGYGDRLGARGTADRFSNVANLLVSGMRYQVPVDPDAAGATEAASLQDRGRIADVGHPTVVDLGGAQRIRQAARTSWLFAARAFRGHSSARSIKSAKLSMWPVIQWCGEHWEEAVQAASATQALSRTNGASLLPQSCIESRRFQNWPLTQNKPATRSPEMGQNFVLRIACLQGGGLPLIRRADGDWGCCWHFNRQGISYSAITRGGLRFAEKPLGRFVIEGPVEPMLYEVEIVSLGRRIGGRISQGLRSCRVGTIFPSLLRQRIDHPVSPSATRRNSGTRQWLLCSLRET